ncbi:Chaperone protein DnaJ [Bienertia sinuspersici]
MKSGEARLLLGFPPNSHPTPSQVKAAYKRKVWDVHPDRVPVDKRIYAESQFKTISEAYNCLLSATYSRVVRTGVPTVHRGAKHHRFVGLPFLFIIFGTVGLGGLNITRAYRKEKETNPSQNPFLP